MRANIYNRLKIGDARRANTLNADNVSVDDIAAELKLNVQAVSDYLSNTAESQKREAVEKVKARTASSKAKSKKKPK